jgi:hypothetical protein
VAAAFHETSKDVFPQAIKQTRRLLMSDKQKAYKGIVPANDGFARPRRRLAMKMTMQRHIS